MKAGILRHRLALRQNLPVQRDENNVPIPGSGGWQTVDTIWGRVEPLSARDFIAASAAQSEVTARITIRYRPGITAAMRILHEDTVYTISGILPDPDSGKEYITLPVSTGVIQE